jgi:hypothetical protein
MPPVSMSPTLASEDASATQRSPRQALRTPRGVPRRPITRIRNLTRTFVVLTTIAAVAAVASAAAASPKSRTSSGSGGSCAVSPNQVASGGALTVSGKAGRSGDWVNAYLYYSDGTWDMIGGSIGSGGSFSLSGSAVATAASLWGPFYPAASGPATVQIYAGSANKDLGMVGTCSFSVT